MVWCKYIVTNLHMDSCTTLQLHITPPQTTTPISHCTHHTITPITQLSPITNQPWLFHHTCTSFTHTHISSSLPCTHREVLFLPRLTFLSVIHPASCDLCVWPRTARPRNSEPVPVTPTSAWYCLRFCPASDIPGFACRPLPWWFCLAFVYPALVTELCLSDLLLCLPNKAALGSIYTASSLHT